MIDERELLAWLESHKILSLTYVPGEKGEVYYGIGFVAIRAKIREMRGGADDGTAEEKSTER